MKNRETLKRLFVIMFFSMTFVVGATFVYYFIGEGEWSLFECFYMTMISITTVGYGEIMDFSNNPAGRIFSIVVIIWGYMLLVLFISTVAEMFVTGFFKTAMKKLRVGVMMRKIKNHYIVCGFGEMGYHVAAEIFASGKPLAIVDNHKDIYNLVEKKLSSDIPVIKGDASEESTLNEAGIDKARGIILALPEDKDNLFVLITARACNSTIRVAVKCVKESNKKKFIKAGAFKVIVPTHIGGMRLASELIRPAVTTFLDVMLKDRDHNLRIGEILLKKAHKCVGKTLRESSIRKSRNVLVMAVAYPNGDFIYNPPPDFALSEGQKLIVLGETQKINDFEMNI